jgi:hypothetical protein
MCDACGCSSNAIGLSQANMTGRPEDPYGKYDGVGGTNNPNTSN